MGEPHLIGLHFHKCTVLDPRMWFAILTNMLFGATFCSISSEFCTSTGFLSQRNAVSTFGVEIAVHSIHKWLQIPLEYNKLCYLNKAFTLPTISCRSPFLIAHAYFYNESKKQGSKKVEVWRFDNQLLYLHVEAIYFQFKSIVFLDWHPKSDLCTVHLDSHRRFSVWNTQSNGQGHATDHNTMAKTLQTALWRENCC